MAVDGGGVVLRVTLFGAIALSMRGDKIYSSEDLKRIA